MIHFLRALDQSWELDFFATPIFRAAMAMVCAFLIALLVGPGVIRLLKKRQVLDQVAKGDSKRLDALSLSKESTPTLGGLILFGAVIASTCLWARLDERFVLLILGFVVGLALLGLADDLTKLRSRRRGLLARHKLLCQILLSLAVAWFLYAFPLQVHMSGRPASETWSYTLFFPVFRNLSLPLGILFIPMVVFVTTGASNAVNLTDGLDGLASGCSVLVAGAFTIVALVVGNEAVSGSLNLPYVVGAEEVGVFLAALVGGGLGFLWFNCHPAEIFMGDTGALPLGGALGLAAVLCKQEVLLALVGGVLVMEAFSVILQVGAFKIWRRRVFLIAPLHHHFQFKGHPESTITVRFWVVGAVLALISLVTLRI